MRHSGIICAANRETVFSELKARGIRPSSVRDAPGLLNIVLGKGKRWLAICILSVVSAALLLSLSRRPPARLENSAVASPRHFVELPKEFSFDLAFANPGERYLATFALPGVKRTAHAVNLDDLEECLKTPLLINPEDTEEVRELKCIVTGMKEDLRLYLDSGFGNVSSYIIRLEERQAMEADYRDRVLLRLKAGLIAMDEANAILSAMGLAPADKH